MPENINQISDWDWQKEQYHLSEHYIMITFLYINLK